MKYRCQICDRDIDDFVSIAHIKAEEYLQDLIRRDHPEWKYVEIDSVPQGARGASAYIDGNYFTTPATVLLKRSHHFHEYQILVQRRDISRVMPR